MTFRQYIQQATGKRATTAFIFIITAVISGIVGNRTDAFLVDNVVPTMGQAIDVPPVTGWFLLYFFCASLGLVIYFVWYLVWFCQKQLKSDNQILTELSELDEQFFALLENVNSCSDTDEALRRLVKAYLAKIANVFDTQHPKYNLDDCYSVVYRPSPSNRDSLVVWTGNRMPDDIQHVVYPLGAVEYGEKRGIPAHVFLDEGIKTPLVERVVQQPNGHWTIDNYHYKPLVEATQKPSFRSLAAIRLNSSNHRFGVLCFYTMYPDKFDDQQLANKLLIMFAKRISFAIKLVEQQPPGQSQPVPVNIEHGVRP